MPYTTAGTSFVVEVIKMMMMMMICRRQNSFVTARLDI